MASAESLITGTAGHIFSYIPRVTGDSFSVAGPFAGDRAATIRGQINDAYMQAIHGESGVTFCFLFNTPNVVGTQYLMFCQESSAHSATIYISGDDIAVFSRSAPTDGAQFSSAANIITADTWEFIAVYFDFANDEVGIKDNSADWVTDAVTYDSTTADWDTIGNGYMGMTSTNSGSSQFDGALAYVGIFTGVRTNAQMEAIRGADSLLESGGMIVHSGMTGGMRG